MAPEDHPEFLRQSKRPAPRETAAEPHTPAPAAPLGSPESWIHERTRVAVGRGVNVSGRLIFGEPVRIEGYFKGEVTSTDLVVIEEQARVEGRVKAARLVVMGELRGDIAGCTRVYLGSRSRVHGDISTENLTICEGCYYSGTVKMQGIRAENHGIA